MKSLWPNSALLVCFTFALAAKAAPVRVSGCAETAEAAVAQLLANSIAGQGTQGFRVDAIHVDPIHHQQWAMVASCAEPAKPMAAMLLPHSDAVMQEVQREAIAIRTGDHVVVVGRPGESPMQLAGSAMEPGAAGQRVRVRLELVMDGEVKPTIECKVLRPGVVEMER